MHTQESRQEHTEHRPAFRVGIEDGEVHGPEQFAQVAAAGDQGVLEAGDERELCPNDVGALLNDEGNSARDGRQEEERNFLGYQAQGGERCQRRSGQ